jgi:hypothetical protein
VIIPGRIGGGHLWARYLKARDELDKATSEGKGRREIERRTGQLRDRLAGNYMISWGVLGLLGGIETNDPDLPGKKRPSSSRTRVTSLESWSGTNGPRHRARGVRKGSLGR